MAEMLANAWNAIGVKTELRTLEFSALVDLVYSGETQAFLLGFLPGGNDGEFYRTLFQTGGENAAWINYSNPEVDELFDLVLGTMMRISFTAVMGRSTMARRYPSSATMVSLSSSISNSSPVWAGFFSS